MIIILLKNNRKRLFLFTSYDFKPLKTDIDMKYVLFILFFCSNCFYTNAQTRQGEVLSQEYCKQITEYYCKQYIVDEVLQVPDRKSVGIYIHPITAAKSGELTTVLYQCDSLHKKGLVFAFWNDYSTGIILPFKGYGFYNLDFEQAKELLNSLESLVDQENKILDDTPGNLVYKSDDLTFLFYNRIGDFGSCKGIRVWWKTFDSDWTVTNLQTTIKRFRKFFNSTK